MIIYSIDMMRSWSSLKKTASETFRLMAVNEESLKTLHILEYPIHLRRQSCLFCAWAVSMSEPIFCMSQELFESSCRVEPSPREIGKRKNKNSYEFFIVNFLGLTTKTLNFIIFSNEVGTKVSFDRSSIPTNILIYQIQCLARTMFTFFLERNGSMIKNFFKIIFSRKNVKREHSKIKIKKKCKSLSSQHLFSDMWQVLANKVTPKWVKDKKANYRILFGLTESAY